MNIPLKISPCPIVESTIGINFEPNIVNDAVFGIIYNVIKDRFQNVEAFPILKIPDEIRKNDLILMNQAHYKVTNENIVILIGPRTLSLSCTKYYKGWDHFIKEVDDLFNKIGQLGIIKSVNRLGIRYINLFNFDIFEKINMSIASDNVFMHFNNKFIKVDILNNEFTSTLQVSNNITIKNVVKGALIDIDTFTQKGLDAFFDNYKDLLIKGHNVEKEIFFSLLQKDYLESLEPEYFNPVSYERENNGNT